MSGNLLGDALGMVSPISTSAVRLVGDHSTETKQLTEESKGSSNQSIERAVAEELAEAQNAWMETEALLQAKFYERADVPSHHWHELAVFTPEANVLRPWARHR